MKTSEVVECGQAARGASSIVCATNVPVEATGVSRGLHGFMRRVGWASVAVERRLWTKTVNFQQNLTAASHAWSTSGGLSLTVLRRRFLVFFVIVGFRIDLPHGCLVAGSREDAVYCCVGRQHGMILVVVSVHTVAPDGIEIRKL